MLLPYRIYVHSANVLSERRHRLEYAPPTHKIIIYISLCRLRATERRGDGAVEGGQGALRTPLQALHQEAGTTACRSLYVGVESYSG